MSSNEPTAPTPPTEIEFKWMLSDRLWPVVRGGKTTEQYSILVGRRGKHIKQAYFTTKGGVAAWLSGSEGDRKLLIESRTEGRPSPLVTVSLTDEAYAKHLANSDDQGRLRIPSGFEARVREQTGKNTVTLKHGKEPSRIEYDFDVEPRVAAELMADQAAIVGYVIEKTRYKVDLANGLVAEVDIFHGLNEGLATIEVEVLSLDVEVPVKDWFGERVPPGELGNASLAMQPWTMRSHEKTAAPDRSTLG